jgi:micrococcal nuclease
MLVTAGGAGAAESVRQEGPLAVAEVLAGDLLRLADGRAVRLAGIRVPAGDAEDPSAARFAEKARAALRRLLESQAITLGLAEAPYDRYGRLVAQIERGDGPWLQGALLERGLAQVQTRPGEAARAAAMLALERSARAAGRGLGAEPAFMPLDASAVRDGACAERGGTLPRSPVACARSSAG